MRSKLFFLMKKQKNISSKSRLIYCEPPPPWENLKVQYLASDWRQLIQRHSSKSAWASTPKLATGHCVCNSAGHLECKWKGSHRRVQWPWTWRDWDKAPRVTGKYRWEKMCPSSRPPLAAPESWWTAARPAAVPWRSTFCHGASRSLDSGQHSGMHLKKKKFFEKFFNSILKKMDKLYAEEQNGFPAWKNLFMNVIEYKNTQHWDSPWKNMFLEQKNLHFGVKNWRKNSISV